MLAARGLPVVPVIVVCVFVAGCVLRAWYETRIAPQIRTDLERLNPPTVVERERFTATYGTDQ